jgi:hypothetical protein
MQQPENAGAMFVNAIVSNGAPAKRLRELSQDGGA